MRFEYGSDPWISAPDNPAWVHAGHAIVIDSHMVKSNSSSGKSGGDVVSSSNTKTDKSSSQSPTPSQKQSQIVQAYKFGDRPPTQAVSGKFMGGLLSRHNSNRQERAKGSRHERQQDHDILSYIKAIELITKKDILWPQHFVGEEGTGVSGLNHEKRRMV